MNIVAELKLEWISPDYAASYLMATSPVLTVLGSNCMGDSSLFVERGGSATDKSTHC